MAETPTSRFEIRANLGPEVEIATLAEFLNSFAKVATFAIQCQELVDRNEALFQVMRGPIEMVGEMEEINPYWFRRPGYYYPLLPAMAALGSSPDWNALLREYGAWAETGSVRVERLEYRNPIEGVILASGSVVIWLLRLIREWPYRRRINEAEASGVESRIAEQQRLRHWFVDQVIAGEVRLSPEQLLSLLDSDTIDAMRVLGDGPLEIGEIEPGPGESASDSDDS